jgi:hypothetical protein
MMPPLSGAWGWDRKGADDLGRVGECLGIHRYGDEEANGGDDPSGATAKDPAILKLRPERAKSLVKSGADAWPRVGCGLANLQSLRYFTSNSAGVRMGTPVIRHTPCVWRSFAAAGT